MKDLDKHLQENYPPMTESEAEQTIKIMNALTPDPWKQCDCGMPGGYHIPDCELLRNAAKEWN